MANPVTRNLTILMTDIKEFTPKTSRMSRAGIASMLEEHKNLVLPVLEGKGGKLVKTIGDAFLMVFESPTDAVLAGIAVQEVLREHNADKHADDRIDVRVAINLGEVNIADNDVFGDAVNITARIEGIAEAGEVYFTEAVYLAMNKKEVPSSEVGLFHLKGVSERIRVYKVVRENPVGGVAAPVAPAKGLLSFLKRRMAPLQAPAVGQEMVNAPLLKRAVAVGIDLALCGLLASTFFPKDKTEYRVRMHSKKSKQITEQQVQAVAKTVEDELKKVDSISFGKDGFRAGDVVFSTAGLKVGDAVQWDKSGIKVKAPAPGKGGVQEIKLDIPDIAKEDIDEEILQKSDDMEVGKRTRKAKSPVFAFLWLAYSTFFLVLWSATPGKKILKLRVVTLDGRALDWKIALVRTLFTFVSFAIAALGYLWALWEKDRRTWHDLIAGTRVVQA
ncbi:MAG: RDD family protein [Elusimicrobiota bacterium]